jgi:hypothetical protein
MKDEALKLALEALEFNQSNWQGKDKAITTIKQALAAPVQEPVAQAWAEGYRAGIADERTSEANIGIAGMGMKVEPARNNPYRTTTPRPQPAPVQEPVAWINAEKRTFEWNGPVLWNTPTVAVLNKIPLYTTPPTAQRQWVGLTDEEANELWESIDSDWELMKRTEAKLREKNHA